MASHWSARKIVSLFLIAWGICAVGCGLVTDVSQFKIMRFMLGVAESGFNTLRQTFIAHIAVCKSVYHRLSSLWPALGSRVVIRQGARR